MLDQLISKTLTGQRFNLFVLGGFALATLLLASAGVYGVMSFSPASARVSSASVLRSARNVAIS